MTPHVNAWEASRRNEYRSHGVFSAGWGFRSDSYAEPETAKFATLLRYCPRSSKARETLHLHIRTGSGALADPVHMKGLHVLCKACPGI